MSLLFNMLSRLAITFLPRSKHLLISWLQSTSTVILEPKKVKSDTVSTVSPSISHEVMGPDAMILVFWMLSFKPTFSLSSFTFIRRLFSSPSLSAVRVVSSAYLRLFIFLSAILIPALINKVTLSSEHISSSICQFLCKAKSANNPEFNNHKSEESFSGLYIDPKALFLRGWSAILIIPQHFPLNSEIV